MEGIDRSPHTKLDSIEIYREALLLCLRIEKSVLPILSGRLRVGVSDDPGTEYRVANQNWGVRNHVFSFRSRHEPLEIEVPGI
jgi:hypothetical protein